MIGMVLKTHNNLALVKMESGSVQVGEKLNIRKHRERRNLSQNSLYWLFCEFVGDELGGMTKDEIHSGFAGVHLKKTRLLNGREFRTVCSTAELDSGQFSDYFDRCNQTALEYGVDTGKFWAEYDENYRRV